MRSYLILTALFHAALYAEDSSPERLLSALLDRSLAEQAMRMKTDDRIALYQKISEYKPENFHYQNLLATAYLQKMRETADPTYLDRAARVVGNVLAADGRNYEALRLRSQMELERHNFARAAEDSKEMTRIGPDDPWNWGMLGDALMEMGDYDNAASAYQKMIALRPDLASYNRASYYRFIAGDIQGAIDVMKQAIAAGSGAPENIAWCLADLGSLYFKSGRIAEAAEAYTAALRVFPGYHPAHAGLGRVYAAQGKTKEAIESYQRAQAAVPYVEYAAALEQLFAASGRKEEARRQAALIDTIDKLERAAGQTANRNLAMVYADQGRNLARARELMEAEVRVRRDVYTWDALAWVQYKSGQYEEAEKMMAKALAMGTPDPAFYYHAGMIAKAAGKREEARARLEHALSGNAKFDPWQAPLAQAALREVQP